MGQAPHICAGSTYWSVLENARRNGREVRQAGRQSLSQAGRQSLSHSVRQSLSQAVRQSLSQAVTQSGRQPLSQAATQSGGHSGGHSVSQAVSQTGSHSVRQSLSQAVTQSGTQAGRRCATFRPVAIFPPKSHEMPITSIFYLRACLHSSIERNSSRSAMMRCFGSNLNGAGENRLNGLLVCNHLNDSQCVAIEV